LSDPRRVPTTRVLRYPAIADYSHRGRYYALREVEDACKPKCGWREISKVLASVRRSISQSCSLNSRDAASANGFTPFEHLALYDLKAKGATDMWRNKVPLEQIQALYGHYSVTTTEIYVKAHWVEPIEANNRKIS